MRILVTGTTGFIGGRIAAHLQRAGHSVTGTHRPAEAGGSVTASPLLDGVASVPLDLGKPIHISDALRVSDFDAVVHGAAMAGLGQCELAPEAALAANSTATAAIAIACGEAGIRFIALSTDQVFAGGPPALRSTVPPRGYREDDATEPVNYYGITKQMAERTLLNMNAPGVTIVRLALVVGRSLRGGRSSSEQLIAQVMRGQVPSLYRDEFRTPVCVADVCSAIEELLPMNGVRLLHLGGPQRMSRVELGQRILRLAGMSDSCNAVDVPEPTVGQGQRPRDVALDSSMAEKLLKRPPRQIERFTDEFACG